MLLNTMKQVAMFFVILAGLEGTQKTLLNRRLLPLKLIPYHLSIQFIISNNYSSLT